MIYPPTRKTPRVLHRALARFPFVARLSDYSTNYCDGVVDAADLACVATIDERDIVLSTLNTLPGDLDGNGDVAFSDFLVLSANFGQDLPSYTDGNIDLEGGVAFSDFLTLSANFGQVPAGGVAAAVPEPSSLALLSIGSLLFGLTRRRRS